MKGLRDADRVLLFLIVVLAASGLVAVFSASSVQAADQFNDGTFFLRRQALFCGVGFGVMLLVAAMRVDIWHHLATLAMVVVTVLLALVLVSKLGVERGGARRWLDMGFFLVQPSELARLATVLYVAHKLSTLGHKVRRFKEGVVYTLLWPGGVALLILAERDFGGAVLVMVLAMVLLFAAGARATHVLPLMGLGLIAGAFLAMSEGYRARRVMAFLDPWADPSDGGYHIIQSWLAFRHGGFWGQGIGNGVQKLFYLPEAHTDFVFSVVAEERGAIGALVVVALFVALVLRGMEVSVRARTLFGRLMGHGVVFSVGFGAMLNLWVVTGLAPTKGLALPFFSYGGSSLLSTFAAMGLLLGVSVDSTQNRNRRSEDPRPKGRRQVPSSSQGAKRTQGLLRPVPTGPHRVVASKSPRRRS